MTKRQSKTGDNALPLTAFALAFSPVSPLSVAAFAALKVSFPGACPGKDDLLFGRRDNIRLFAKLTLMFSLRATLSGRTGDKIKTGEKTHEQAFCTARVLSPRKKRHERKMLMCCEAVERVGILRILSTIVIFLFLIVESLP